MTPTDPLYHEIASQVRRGITRLGRRLRAERSSGALSSNKASVLGRLFHSGPITAGEVAGLEHLQPQSLTRVFADLEAEGLIVRRRSDRDGRCWVLDLTDAGRDVLTRDLAELDTWLASALDGLTETEV